MTEERPNRPPTMLERLRSPDEKVEKFQATVKRAATALNDLGSFRDGRHAKRAERRREVESLWGDQIERSEISVSKLRKSAKRMDRIGTALMWSSPVAVALFLGPVFVAVAMPLTVVALTTGASMLAGTAFAPLRATHLDQRASLQSAHTLRFKGESVKYLESAESQSKEREAALEFDHRALEQEAVFLASQAFRDCSDAPVGDHHRFKEVVRQLVKREAASLRSGENEPRTTPILGLGPHKRTAIKGIEPIS